MARAAWLLYDGRSRTRVHVWATGKRESSPGTHCSLLCKAARMGNVGSEPVSSQKKGVCRGNA